jgi:hypothetical protein
LRIDLPACALINQTVWKLERAGGSQEIAGDFRHFSSIARSLARKSSIAARHFSIFFEFSHSL